ncbi:MAG TPA: type II toxin-antitoxin system Phd/YefM family antitoxin [Dehalococcoidia bacterium]|nr:type II toxin-antitoxin system Phd/YefM family antitoxin [Dehalococcoidia bacterium]
MPKVLSPEDIHPLSEFRAHSAAFVQKLRETKRPVVLTQHGRSAAVLLDVAEYEALIEQIELLQDIHTAEEQLAKGEGVAHAKAKGEVLAGLRK